MREALPRTAARSVSATVSAQLQDGMDGVDTQRGCMFRFVGETTDRRFEIVPGDMREFGAATAVEQFSERRSGGDGCRTAPNLVGALGDGARFHPDREAEDIAADRIRDFYRNGGRRKLANVARVLEVVDELGAHVVIL